MEKKNGLYVGTFEECYKELNKELLTNEDFKKKLTECKTYILRGDMISTRYESSGGLYDYITFKPNKFYKIWDKTYDGRWDGPDYNILEFAEPYNGELCNSADFIMTEYDTYLQIAKLEKQITIIKNKILHLSTAFSCLPNESLYMDK